MHVTAGIFGNPEIAKKLGKAGSGNDIIMYNHASSDGVFTYVHPNSERIHSLLQVIGMIDVPIVVFSEMTKEFGEQLVALDAAGFENGFLVLDGIPEDQMRTAIRGSSLEKFELVDNDPVVIKQKLMAIDYRRDNIGSPWIPVDNYFNVKGIGTVVLSVVKRGTIKKFDVLKLEPLGKDVTVKDMQSQDKAVTEAVAGMRLGINLKGVDAEELKRGYVLCKQAKLSKEVTINFSKSRYCKEELEKDKQLFVAVGLQVITGTLISVEEDKLMIKLEHPLVYASNEKSIIASTRQILPRIIGNGIIVG